MKIAIANGGPTDGVALLGGQTTPFPEGAIHPVPNWEEMRAVPEHYRIVDGGAVREMDAAEKKASDNARLDEIKAGRRSEINSRTDELIAMGFSHYPHPAYIFGLAQCDQTNASFLNQKRIAGQDMTGQFFRLKENLDDPGVQNYSFASNADWDVFVYKGSKFVEICTHTGGVMKDALAAATDIDEVNAIVDDRTWEEIDEAANPPV